MTVDVGERKGRQLMADDQQVKDPCDDDKLNAVFKVLADNLARRQEEFNRRNWATVTGIKPWKKWSLSGVMALLLLQVVMIYARLPAANTLWFLSLFLAGFVAALALILTTVINREELKRETPQETLDILAAEAVDDCQVALKLYLAGDAQKLQRARAKINADLGLLEARKNFGSDLLRDIGPAFAASGIVLKLMGLPPSAYPLLTTVVVLFGACVILIRFGVLLVLQSHVMRRKKFLVMLEQAEVLEPSAPAH
jgi:hypothetical protein